MTKYNNPIITGFNPDPSICRVDDTYYLVTSTFEYFPGIPIYKSTNLINWELIGHCLTRDSQLNLEGVRASAGIYAPTIRYHEGRFYVTSTSVGAGGNFIVHTEDPAGEWSEPVLIKQGGIDPSLLFADGKCYFTSTADDKGNFGIHTCEINPMTGEMLSDSVLVSHGVEGRNAEAPHVYKLNGYYYLMLAEGGTEYNHMETIQRSKDIYGPYDSYDKNPFLTNRNAGIDDVACVGHADIVDDLDGNWWIVSLGVRTLSTPENNIMLHNLGRETFLAPMEWTEDDWPKVGNGQMSVDMEAKQFPGEEVQSVDRTIVENFEKEKLALEFTYIRNPHRENYLMDQANKTLVLKGTAESLSTSSGRPTFAGVRQTEFEQTVTVTIQVDGTETDMAAGLTVIYNHEHHYDIIVQRANNGEKQIALRKQIYDTCAINEVVTIPEDVDLDLKVVADKEYYSFYYKYAGNDYEFLGRGAAAAMSTEITRVMSFTGTFFGMFSENTTAKFQGFILEDSNK